jgi:O-acetyl-ADP-ribose deacetylase (regulator of RNase III)
MKTTINKTDIELEKGDITSLKIDAIVNAANEKLAHGGGVAGAISRNGGPSIQQESNQWIKEHGRVKTGTVAITGAGYLPAKYVIHAVGPVMGSGNEDENLKSATLNSCKCAEQYDIKSIAFPAISTGVFGFPVDRCAQLMLQTVKTYAKENTNLNLIVFCLYNQKSLDTFSQVFASLFD